MIRSARLRFAFHAVRSPAMTVLVRQLQQPLPAVLEVIGEKTPAHVWRSQLQRIPCPVVAKKWGATHYQTFPLMNHYRSDLSLSLASIRVCR
jgi:hypothetical protein